MPEQSPNPDLSAAAPPTLSHVIGNARVVEQVRITLESSFSDSRPFPHALFLGEKGTGKTLLAQIVAKEMGATCKEVLGQTITCGGDLTRVLLELDEGDCLFIDEVHTLPHAGQVALFRAVEESKVFLEPAPFRPQPKAIKLPPFTLLAATTHEGGILPPLIDRFKLVCRMGVLTAEEMVKLLRQRATALRWNVEEPVFMLVAKRCRGVPRVALRLFESTYRTSRSEQSAVVRVVDAVRTFELEGLFGEAGLSQAETGYLRLLAEADEYGLAIRQNVLAARLGLPLSTLTNVIEPALLREGLIDKAEHGRRITPRGLEQLREGRA